MIGGAAVLVIELVVLFFGVAFAVHVLQRRMGPERIKAWMGGPPVISALKGIAIGFVTPFCTYSAVPLLVGFRQADVPPAGYVSFIAAAPVLDPVLFGALVLIVGLDVALVYLAVAFVGALALGLLASRTDIARHLKALPVTEKGCSPEVPWQGWKPEVVEGTRAATHLLRSMAPLLLVGVTIGLAIEAYVSPDFAAQVAGEGNRFAIPVAAALGTPLYFNTELFVPIASALTTAGVGVGAVVALTISGAGANVPEFVILGRLAHSRLLVVFIAFVLTIAVTGGVLAGSIVA